MLRLAAVNHNRARAQDLSTKSVQAPVGGWNDRDSLASMDEKFAPILTNYWPEPSKVVLRSGQSSFATGLGSQVNTVMGYKPQTGSSKLFGCAGTSIFDITAGGAVGAAVVTGLTNVRFQKINITTPGGSFLMAVNGADKLRGTDGATWWIDGDGSHDITGVNTATCTDINLHMKRVWLIQPSTCSAWYLPVNSIAGAASQLPFGTIFQRGGQLISMKSWSLDAGNGMTAYSAFFSDQGEVAIYQGFDPSSASTWSLQGVYWVGSPIGGARCSAQFGKDVLFISRDGLLPMAQALVTGRIDTKIALTDNIQNAASSATHNFASSFGWQVIQFPDENMVILNIPFGVGLQQQYAMNTISGAWAKFTGWPANCFELYNDDMYFGANGIVCKAWQGTSDAGQPINAEAMSAFNYFGTKSSFKEFTLARPLVAIDNAVGFRFGINTDFDMSLPTGVPTYTPSGSGKWNSALWGGGQWGGDPAIQKGWQSVQGTGYCAAMHILSSTMNTKIEWNATDFGWKRGGVM